jgi:hypothetical protein
LGRSEKKKKKVYKDGNELHKRLETSSVPGRVLASQDSLCCRRLAVISNVCSQHYIYYYISAYLCMTTLTEDFPVFFSSVVRQMPG